MEGIRRGHRVQRHNSRLPQQQLSGSRRTGHPRSIGEIAVQQLDHLLAGVVVRALAQVVSKSAEAAESGCPGPTLP
jgi:hypothetical protein